MRSGGFDAAAYVTSCCTQPVSVTCIRVYVITLQFTASQLPKVHPKFLLMVAGKLCISQFSLLCVSRLPAA
jgi:hypothetical protein